MYSSSGIVWGPFSTAEEEDVRSRFGEEDSAQIEKGEVRRDRGERS